MHTLFADRSRRRGRALAVVVAMAAGAAVLPGAAQAADAPRVIEMVSPPDTAGQSAEPGGTLGITEPPLLGEGVFVGLNLFTPLFPDQGNGWGTLWQARRGAAGWVRGLLDPPPATQTGDEAFVAQAVTPDASRAVIFSYGSQSLFHTGPIVEHAAPSRLTLREADGTMKEIVSIPYPAGKDAPVPLSLTGTSRDFGTVQFITYAQLSGDAHIGTGNQTYLWRDGTLRVNGVDANGAPLKCGASAAGDVLHPPVSEDGTISYINHGDYQSDQDVCGTPSISPPTSAGAPGRSTTRRPGSPSSSAPRRPRARRPTGWTIWFTQSDPITADDTNVTADLYRSDLPAGGGPATVRCVTCSAPEAQVGRADITAIAGTSSSRPPTPSAASGSTAPPAATCSCSPTTAGSS